ncbi:MAG: glycosyltransferase family 4 protein [Leptospiraceae bacterium]|nr:glycosyltransferase family 4 protein [Leptospiraceae bacterium]MCK6382216.1 glycosyltransferase family 4 protein [Leptospiraceae bacterium]NUM42017.1 glycosyltransferase family 4 protein [Leptospiraceae bacterium]
MNSKKKIAIVSTRFSDRIAGGAERHALKFALLMSEKYEVTVLTTTALDYKTWKNEIESGESFIQDIKIIRFRVDKSRNIKKFNRLLDKIHQKKISWNSKTTDLWLQKQGPFSEKLVQFIDKNQNQFDLFFFVSYLYYPTVKGIQKIKNKSICLPTLHDEIPAYFPIYKESFTNEIVYSFNTIEELLLFKRIFGFQPDRFSVIGVNVDKDIQCNPEEFYLLENSILDSDVKDYAVYIGRFDAGKGIYELVEFFREWKNNSAIDMKLIFIGDDSFRDRDIISVGYVSENEKSCLLQKAKFLINPSSLESFSIVLMEAWINKTPVVVNAKSEVMVGHCIRSNGGLYYSDKESFCKILDYLTENESIRKKLGENGEKYVLKNYSTETVKEKLFCLIDSCI